MSDAYRTENTANFKFEKPATVDELERAEARLGRPLPSDYREFLSHANGGSGFVGDGEVYLWPIAVAVDSNQELHMQAHLPDYLLIGSDDGGEEFFAYDLRDGITIC